MMKRFVVSLIITIFAFAGNVDAAKVYYRTSLTGGASTALDGANGNQLTDGDLAIVADGTDIYHYRLDDDSGAAESSPSIISPDNDAGTKRWILQNVYSVNTGISLPSGREMIGGVIGLEMNPYSGDPDHDVVITTGACRDSTNIYNLSVDDTFTKQIDAPWVAGGSAGGLLNGSVSANELYHIYLLRKDSDGSTDAGFLDDDDAIGTYLPAGYSTYRWIGFVVTDSSANIRNFVLSDENYIFANAFGILTTGTLSMTLHDISSYVPDNHTKSIYVSAYNASGSNVTLGSWTNEGSTTITANTAAEWTSLYNKSTWVEAIPSGSTVAVYINVAGVSTTIYLKALKIIR